ncbi:MAG: PfkB family carbohydrate kinase [Candidatus Thermoplasmatota archaeon]|nr:PfkB family carbohydrate kinase [Candidatus Thermoplasmatota archaeon]
MKVIGSAFVEFSPSAIHKNIEDVRSFRRGIGGSGANIAIAEARLGTKPQLVSAVGGDRFGQFIINELEKEGIECTNVSVEKEYLTGISFYELDAEGRSNYYFYRFPGISMPEEKLMLRGIKFEKEEIVTITEAAIRGAEPDMEALSGARIFYEPNIRKAFWNEQLRERTMKVIENAYAVFPNREELSLITGTKGIDEGAEELLKHTKLVVVKMGSEGARAFFEKRSFSAPGIKIEAKCEIGAGDTFHGAFVAALTEGKDLSEALLLANRAAAFRVATGKFPRKKDLFT